MKPHKGRIDKWRKIPCIGGRGYFISGTFVDHPSAPMMAPIGHTSVVMLHNEGTGEIETKYSRYTLSGPERKA